MTIDEAVDEHAKRSLNTGKARHSMSRCKNEPNYKHNADAPDGYVHWHYWADEQVKKGRKQVQCKDCGKWYFE